MYISELEYICGKEMLFKRIQSTEKQRRKTSCICALFIIVLFAQRNLLKMIHKANGISIVNITKTKGNLTLIQNYSIKVSDK